MFTSVSTVNEICVIFMQGGRERMLSKQGSQLPGEVQRGQFDNSPMHSFKCQ